MISLCWYVVRVHTYCYCVFRLEIYLYSKFRKIFELPIICDLHGNYTCVVCIKLKFEKFLKNFSKNFSLCIKLCTHTVNAFFSMKNACVVQFDMLQTYCYWIFPMEVSIYRKQEKECTDPKHVENWYYIYQVSERILG